MYNTRKQSLIDWQILKDGQPFGWITKYKGVRMYAVTFRHLAGEYAGFRTLAEAKKFATSN